MIKHDNFRVFGKIKDSKTGKGIKGLIIEAFDKDRVHDDPLGKTITSTNGDFEITFDKSDFKEGYRDENPDLYLIVKTPSGKTIHTTEDSIRYRASKKEEFNIIIEEEVTKTRKHTLKTNLDLSKVADLNKSETIKVAAVRDGVVLNSRIIKLDEVEKIESIPLEIEYFTPDREKPLGVNFAVGPDVPDKEFAASAAHTRWISSKENWKDFTYKIPDISIPDHIKWWWCKNYTIRGRVMCANGNPVPGAKVEARDVDCFWWWCREDTVGTAITNPDGTFELKFRWCCRFPWLLLRLKDWRINPKLLEKILRLYPEPPLIKLPPLPDPAPDLQIFEDIINIRDSMTHRDNIETSTAEPEMKNISSIQHLSSPTTSPAQVNNLETLRGKLLKALPDNPELHALHIWPWWPWRDCRPDIIFKVTQDCKEPDTVIYEENYFNTRWNIPTLLDGVVLVANEDACCIGEQDPPEGDCFKFSEVGCTSLENIGGNNPMAPVINDLKGFAHPNNLDRPFGGRLNIKGLLGDLADVDYYWIQYSKDGITYDEMPPDMVYNYVRKFWGTPIAGGVPQWNDVLFKKEEIDSHWVFETRENFEQNNNPATWGTTRHWTSNKYMVLPWNSEHPAITDGLYHLQFIAYNKGPGNTLTNRRIMPLCGTETSKKPTPETLQIRIDNRIMGVHPPSIPSHPWGSGYIHKGTVEPDCDIIKVVKNEGPGEHEVKPCSILKLKAGDKISICFNASDTDGHLQAYHLSLHWGESSSKALVNGFSGASAGPITCVTSACTPLPCAKGHEIGPRYQDAVAQGADRPIWHGGNYKINLKGEDFPTCCAYQLRLRTWKRTHRGCDNPYHFHWNVTEYSFTVIREDLIGNPLYKECKEICPPDNRILTTKIAERQTPDLRHLQTHHNI